MELAKSIIEFTTSIFVLLTAFVGLIILIINYYKNKK